MGATVTPVSDADFEGNVLNAQVPTLVDFWAPWCGPCKAVTPILDEIAVEYAEKLNIVKMDVDKNPDVPARYGIRGIPTLILFKDGEIVATTVGAMNKQKLIAFLDGNL